MECIKYNSRQLEDELICINHSYNDFFERDIKIDIVKIKCKKCGYEWIEVV